MIPTNAVEHSDKSANAPFASGGAKFTDAMIIAP